MLEANCTATTKSFHGWATTYAIKGDTDSVQALMMALSESTGEVSLIGMQ